MSSKMSQKENKPNHSKEHYQGIRAAILRKTDVVSHEGQHKSAWNSNRRGKGSRKKIDHGDGESPENKRHDPKISLRFFKWVEDMGENIEERGVKEVSRMFFEIFYLTFEVLSGVIKGVDFINPERLVIKSIEPQGKTDDKA